MYDGLLIVQVIAANAAPDHTVQNALIGATGLVAVALITGYFGTRTRSREPHWDDHNRQTDEEYHRQLQGLITEAEYDQAIAENEVLDLQRRVLVLERFLWRRRYDPTKVLVGDETDEATRSV